AHSWVMAFDTEFEAFEAYARAMPDNALLLVDTYDTLQGVRRAVEVGRKLRASGHELTGIRLDSGDLAYLSIEARKILDEGGFPDAVIVASNELDEHIIASLKQQGAKIDQWGVGTRLVTAYDEPALGGVYKLGAIRGESGAWEYRVKLSEQNVKITTPGMLQVRRFENEQGFAGDMIWDELSVIPSREDGEKSGAAHAARDSSRSAALGMTEARAPLTRTIIDPFDNTKRKTFANDARWRDLLVPVFRRGELVYDVPPLASSRQHAIDELARLHPGIKRLVNPHVYPVGLEKSLHDRRTELIMHARGIAA
ncbi:MAG TPA: hypothetical protein VLU46_00180, partial [Thermoanaerobaculia bacterium]|nr:hypothetical protein [Thermoanaerobaculia bacterium]